MPVKSAGQIPVAAANGNGRLVHEPITAALPNPMAVDVGKVLVVNTFSTTGVIYKYKALSLVDPLALLYLKAYQDKIFPEVSLATSSNRDNVWLGLVWPFLC